MQYENYVGLIILYCVFYI